MFSASHVPNEPGESAISLTTTGLLQIELPHWTARVRIYDNLFQPVPDASLTAQEKPPQSGLCYVEATLPAGIYEVEVALGDKRERQIVAVHPNKTWLIPRKTWSIKFTSPVPFTHNAKKSDAQVRNAENWSREISWPSAPGGDSRLFLFVRTEDPQAHPAFADGLKLLDGDSHLVSNLSEGVQKSARDGWLAFNADLPAGYYILRRGRSGVRIRQQPIYLCAGWETQVFIVAQNRNRPSLRTLTMNMARRGTGFRADDETIQACEAVFDSLGRSEGSRSVVAREKITVLLEGKLENPWLGILAAYALRSALGQARAGDDTNDMAALYKHVMTFLSTIGDHPDVRALNLPENEPAGSFWHPPLLRAGLKWVQEHATRFAVTIPLESLTDVVLDNLVANSPWTAWRKLDRTPLPAGATPQSAPRATNQSSLRKHTETSPPSFMSFRQSIDYNLTPDTSFESLESREVAAEAPAKGIQPQPERAPLMTRTVLHHASLATIPQNPDDLQETVEVNQAFNQANLLNNITALEVSAASGLPLARTEQTLTELRQGAQEVLDSPLTVTENAIIEYAVQKGNRPKPVAVIDGSVGGDSGNTRELSTVGGSFVGPGNTHEFAVADAPAPAEDPSVTAADSSTVAAARPGAIEESVTKLRTEADRLALATGDDSYVRELYALGERLYDVANRLLWQANFAVRTDVQGRIQQPNAAFLALLAPTTVATTGESQRPAILDAWEKALAAAPPGRSTLRHPVPHQPFSAWDLRRTAILDERDKVEQAYLFVFRGTNVLHLATDALQQIESLLSELALYASLCTYGGAKSGRDYLQRLESNVLQLEQLSEVVETPLPR